MLIRSPSTTLALGQKAAQSIYYAFEQAERIGLPITDHVTINFAATRIDPTEAVAAFARLRLNFFGKAARRYWGFEPTGMFAFENARDGIPFDVCAAGKEHNVHVHWALHLPPSIRGRFEADLFEWVEIVAGGITDIVKVIKITQPDVRNLRRYILVGTNEKWAPVYGAVAEPQGAIVGGRRSGTTANLRKSRRIALDRVLGVRRKIPARPTPPRPRASRMAAPAG